MTEDDKEHERDEIRVGGVHTYQYCPYCGSELEKEQFDVTPYKTNIEVICPVHGVLVNSTI